MKLTQETYALFAEIDRLRDLEQITEEQWQDRDDIRVRITRQAERNVEIAARGN